MVQAVIKADLHIHSLVSDGEAHPHQVVKYAEKVGINVIAITDHNTFLGSIIARRLGNKHVTVIYGSEVRTEFGDILLLCENYLRITPSEFTKLIESVERQNCLLIPAHPLAIHRKGMGYYLVKYYMNLWDGIEVFNGESDPLINVISYKLFRDIGKTKIANSDAHILDSIGTTYTVINVNSCKVEDVLEALRKGMTIPVYKFHALLLKVQVLRISWGIKRFLRRMPEDILMYGISL